MGLFTRSCKSCGTPADQVRVADQVIGRKGDVEVELRDFPYRSCACGQLTRWAFDPGLEFSEQLFFTDDGVPTARGRGDHARCARCGEPLGAPQRVRVEAQAHLEGFAPIEFAATLPGYACQGCGLEQAPEGSFDTSLRRTLSDGAAALEEATRSLGLEA
jgi:hypothetical protein